MHALAVVHNFICVFDPDDLPAGNEQEEIRASSFGTLSEGTLRAEVQRANEKRDVIAKAMWEDYKRRTC